MRKVILSLFFLVILPSFILGQGTFKVKGKVTDSKLGEPLIGASVVLKPSNLGAMTDINGDFSFEVPSSLAKGQAVELTASYINYKKKTIKVVLDGVNITQNFALEEDIFQSDEIVVTGIASKTSKSVAEIAVGRVSATDLQKVNTYGSLSQLVQGKVAGVQLNTSSGNVGSGWRFNVRGGGGSLSGSGQPTIYIDGVRVDNSEIIGYGVGGQGMSVLSNFNSNDIEKIEFLKGSAAAAMYGTSGSNGVVLITTKAGALGTGGGVLPISVDYKFNYGFNERLVKYSTDDFVSANDANANWQKGPIRDNNLSVAGGYASLKYYASFSSREEYGILPATYGDRKGTNVKISAVPTSKLSVVFSAGYSVNKMRRPTNDNIIYGWLGNTLLNPTSYLYIPEMSLRAINDAHDIKSFRGSANATYKLLPQLELYGSFGYENSQFQQQRLYPYGYNFGGLVGTKGEKAIYNRSNNSYTYDFNAKYFWEPIDQLSITSIVGGQFFDRYFADQSIIGQQFGSGLITSEGSLLDITGYGESSFNTREGGFYTEQTVNYLDQYYVTIGLKREYSSVIGKSAPSIFYPKGSFAIRLDKYDFLPSFVNLAKFRMAYGITGTPPGLTDGIPISWTFQKGGYGAGAIINSLGNPDIEPESSKELEVGLDFELFKEWSFELTYYNKNNKNSIIFFPLSSSTGKTRANLPYNVGAMKASGFETMIQYFPIRGVDYSLDFSLIWNYQKNEVTDLGGAQPIYAGFNSSNVIKEGLSRSEFYAPKVLGATFDAAGKYFGINATTDNQSLGNPIPNHSGSITVNFKFLKNFVLYGFGEFGLNNKVYNYTLAFGARTGNNPKRNDLSTRLAALTPKTQEYIDIANQYAKTDGRYVDNYLEDASYFAIRELSLSYDFTDLLGEFDLLGYVKYVTLGISARNVLRITKYSGPDFEINSFGARSIAQGTDFLTLQTPRTVNFWVRLGF